MNNQDFYKNINHINHALVEDVRPPMYKGFKYWGKKPHNIWRKYIETYTQEGDVVLDFFAGSGVACLEAIQVGRRVISIDLNPISEFNVRFLISKFDENKFIDEFTKLYNKILDLENRLSIFHTSCKVCGTKSLIINSKWDRAQLYEVAYECEKCEKRYVKKPDDKDLKNVNEIDKLSIPYWYPTKKFPNSSSFNASFLRMFGDTFDGVWTKRNLYINAFIFDEIKKIKDEDIKTALLYGFISKLHLTTKMCVPRREEANRPFSTSWGRSAYIAPNRQMEMNPLIIFTRSCTEKQGILSVKKSTKELIENKVNLAKDIKEFFNNKNKNLLLVTGDALQLSRIIPEKSIDFIITDPPYGGLVQYLDLSSLWLVWLENYDKKYTIRYEDEITINNSKDFNHYHNMLKKAFTEGFKVLKDGHYLVTTFHNDKIKIWNSLLRAVVQAGFEFEKIIYQPNRRTGESNVANPYGTSASDYYLRYKKSEVTSQKEVMSSTDFEKIVIDVAKNIITQRGEPTEKAFLLNGIYVELAKYGHYLEGDYEDIDKILEKHKGKTFILKEGTNEMLGSKWWLADNQIKFPNLPLSDRIETAILDVLRREIKVTYDEILANIFEKFPNGLTPDIKNIKSIIEEYAEKDGKGFWRLKQSYHINENVHSLFIGRLAEIGQRLGFDTWVGIKEQGDTYNGNKLSKMCKPFNFSVNGYKENELGRIKTIDVIWYKDGRILYIFEVENSTSITSALERASHIKEGIVRVILLPKERMRFFQRKLKEPLFNDYFKRDKWIVKYYEDVDFFVKKYGNSKFLTTDKFNIFLNK